MNRKTNSLISSEKGSVLIYVIVTLVILLVVASISTYVSTQLRITGKRKSMEAAYQLASGGASVVAYDLETAFKASASDIGAGLISDGGYDYDPNRKAYQTYFDSGDRWDQHILQNLTLAAIEGWDEALYSRTIPVDVLGTEVEAELWLPTDGTQEARIITNATVDGVTEQVTLNLGFSYGFGGAIISTHQGTPPNGVSNKGNAQDGNVVIFPAGNAISLVDGGILANGSVNYPNPTWPIGG